MLGKTNKASNTAPRAMRLLIPFATRLIKIVTLVFEFCFIFVFWFNCSALVAFMAVNITRLLNPL